MFAHQDWDPIVFHKKTQEKKPDYGSHKTHEKKVIEGLLSDETAIKIVSSELAHAIVTARCAAKLTQDQLARNVNMAPAVIKEIESGKAQYKPQEIATIAKTLHLNTSNIKKTRN